MIKQLAGEKTCRERSKLLEEGSGQQHKIRWVEGGREEMGEKWRERKGREGHEGRKRGRVERERGLLIRTEDFQSSDFSHPNG